MARDDRYKDLQLSQLRSFCLAATAGNFTTAARALGLSAPTVWQQVRALERRLRTTLMRRRGRTVELTPEGRVLLELIEPHVQGLDSLESLFLDRQALAPRQLMVAAIPIMASYLLRTVQDFIAAQPAVRLRLQIHVWFDDVVHMVEQGHADLGAIFYDREAPRSSHLQYERLFDMHFSLLMPPDHPLARKKRVSAADLAEHPLIVAPEGSFARRTLDRLLQRHDLTGKVHLVMEASLFEVIRQYVAAGVGVGVLHVPEGLEPPAGVKVRPLEVEEAISAGIVARKGAHLAGPVRAFQETARRYLSRPSAAGQD